MNATKNYLQKFSDRANETVKKYEKLADKYITYIFQASNKINIIKNYKLQLSDNLIENLNRKINRVNS